MTGLFLLVVPSFVVRLLFGVSPVEPVALARICGIALLTIAAACWPRQASDNILLQQCLAMLLYNAAVGSLLVFVGLIGAIPGVLLWPAALFHLLIAASLAIAGRGR